MVRYPEGTPGKHRSRHSNPDRPILIFFLALFSLYDRKLDRNRWKAIGLFSGQIDSDSAHASWFKIFESTGLWKRLADVGWKDHRFRCRPGNCSMIVCSAVVACMEMILDFLVHFLVPALSCAMPA